MKKQMGGEWGIVSLAHLIRFIYNIIFISSRIAFYRARSSRGGRVRKSEKPTQMIELCLSITRLEMSYNGKADTNGAHVSLSLDLDAPGLDEMRGMSALELEMVQVEASVL